MRFEMLVGLQIENEKVYQNYREAMRPILEIYGGGFRYDFKVSEVLANQEGRAINRVFTIGFKDRESRDAFFSHEAYQKVKAEFFEKSVGATTVISEYDLIE